MRYRIGKGISFQFSHLALNKNETAAASIEVEAPNHRTEVPHPVDTQSVAIDDHCVGDRWSAHDETRLARLIAIIAMGQAAYAAHILEDLLPVTPAFTHDDLRREAIVRMTVQEEEKRPRTGYPRYQRDGFIFEAISWITARQSHGQHVLLQDPHVSATSQGIDGLMIELATDKTRVVMTTIFEDKCTNKPRDTFVHKVIPALLDRHNNKRSAELVASASALLRMAGITQAAAAQLAEAVIKQQSSRLTVESRTTAARERKSMSAAMPVGDVPLTPNRP